MSACTTRSALAIVPPSVVTLTIVPLPFAAEFALVSTRSVVVPRPSTLCRLAEERLLPSAVPASKSVIVMA